MFARLAIRLIEHYQRRGGGNRIFAVDCNFEPGCSEYTKQAIERFGFLNGTRLGFRRIRRCNQRDLPHKIHDPLPVCGCGATKASGEVSSV